MKNRVKVLKENETGRNEKFRDNLSKIEMTRNQFVKAIEKGEITPEEGEEEKMVSKETAKAT